LLEGRIVVFVELLQWICQGHWKVKDKNDYKIPKKTSYLKNRQSHLFRSILEPFDDVKMSMSFQSQEVEKGENRLSWFKACELYSLNMAHDISLRACNTLYIYYKRLCLKRKTETLTQFSSGN